MVKQLILSSSSELSPSPKRKHCSGDSGAVAGAAVAGAGTAVASEATASAAVATVSSPRGRFNHGRTSRAILPGRLPHTPDPPVLQSQKTAPGAKSKAANVKQSLRRKRHAKNKRVRRPQYRCKPRDSPGAPQATSAPWRTAMSAMPAPQPAPWLPGAVGSLAACSWAVCNAWRWPACTLRRFQNCCCSCSSSCCSCWNSSSCSCCICF